MAPSTRPPLPLRLVPIAALFLSLALSLGTVSAAVATVTANPALVPFDPVPGKPGSTALTFNAGGAAGLTACVQDNGKTPTLAIGTVDPTTPLAINFPFIQAGAYTFWLSADSNCNPANKLMVLGTPVQATATRLGPTGLAGKDDIAFLPNPTVRDLSISATQKFPLPGEQVCIMSGDGAQMTVAVKVGQDVRLYGAGAVTTTVTPFAGQNGCYDIPWIVNGYYGASITRSPDVASFVGFCTGDNKPDSGVITAPPNPTGTPPVSGGGAWHCAKIAYQVTAGGTTTPVTPKLPPNPGFPVSRGAVLTGAAMTGADNHAIQTCFYAAVPGGGTSGTIFQYGNKAQSYNGSGAMNLTPLPLDYPTNSVAFLLTYDVTNPGAPGGVGAAVRDCPLFNATFSGGAFASYQFVPTNAEPPNMNLLDVRFFLVS